MFITGMDGYLGWLLAQHLVDRGHQVADADALFPWITEDTRATSWGSSRLRGIGVIEDGAHSLSAAIGDQPVGSIADVTAYSFQATKSITAGDGGMLTMTDHRLADRVEQLRLHGIERDVWRWDQQSAGWRYEVVEAGFKANMTDFQAALGRSQLSRESVMRTRRTAIVGRYSATFAVVLLGFVTACLAIRVDSPGSVLYRRVRSA